MAERFVDVKHNCLIYTSARMHAQMSTSAQLLLDGRVGATHLV